MNIHTQSFSCDFKLLENVDKLRVRMFGKTGDVYIQTEMDIHGLDIQFSGSYSDSELLTLNAHMPFSNKNILFKQPSVEIHYTKIDILI